LVQAAVIFVGGVFCWFGFGFFLPSKHSSQELKGNRFEKLET